MAEPGFFGTLSGTMQSPLFLGGLGLLSGGGMPAMSQGMQSGILAAKSAREEEQYQRQQQQQRDAMLQQWGATPPAWAKNLPAGILDVARLGGDQAPQILGNVLAKHPEMDLERQKAAAQIEMMKAHTGLYGAQAKRELEGGKNPATVQEWTYYNSLSPEDQARYRQMKRADKTVDTGTEFVNVSNPNAPRIQKDVMGKEAAAAMGKAQGQAAAALPTVVASTNRLIDSIDAVINDPNLPKVTGFIGGRIPKTMQTEGMAETQSRLDQVAGQTFMQAYNDLRGAGAISNQEGAKAEAALNRLRTQNMSTQAYIAASKEFRNEVLKMAALAKERAGGRGQATPSVVPSGNYVYDPATGGLKPAGAQ